MSLRDTGNTDISIYKQRFFFFFYKINFKDRAEYIGGMGPLQEAMEGHFIHCLKAWDGYLFRCLQPWGGYAFPL